MTVAVRPVTPLEESKFRRLKRQPIPPPPKIAWLALDQLVVAESYQRSVSAKSEALIRRLVETWDWNCFKPLSVAATGGGLYEIVDGQHTAIAAATHGAIETLPCLVLDATTVAARARAFVGINRDRVALTAFALYRSRLAAEDPEAVAVQEGLEAAGAELFESFSAHKEYEAGAVNCVGTLLGVVRRAGKNRLAKIMKICIDAGVAPVQSALIKGLDEILAAPEHPSAEALTYVIERLGDDEVMRRAAQRRSNGSAATGSTAVLQVLLHECDRAAV